MVFRWGWRNVGGTAMGRERERKGAPAVGLILHFQVLNSSYQGSSKRWATYTVW